MPEEDESAKDELKKWEAYKKRLQEKNIHDANGPLVKTWLILRTFAPIFHFHLGMFYPFYAFAQEFKDPKQRKWAILQLIVILLMVVPVAAFIIMVVITGHKHGK